jgi:hypothetical protein
MVAAIKQLVTVQPGGRVEISSSELTPGTQAEVIVLVENGRSPTPDEQLRALETLQHGLQLTPATAAEWLAQSCAERAAFGERK